MISGVNVMAMNKEYEYDAVIQCENKSNKTYATFPEIMQEDLFKGKMKVRASFDGIPYIGKLSGFGDNTEVSSFDKKIYIIKAIRESLGKNVGDIVHVTIKAI